VGGAVTRLADRVASTANADDPVPRQLNSVKQNERFFDEPSMPVPCGPGRGGPADHRPAYGRRAVGSAATATDRRQPAVTPGGQRIQALRTQLHITDAQLPQWTAFAQTMRDNATSTDALFRRRAGAAATMSALDNMKSYAEVARAYADNTEALAKAFEALYGVLTDQQKQTIDTLFRQEAARTAAQQQTKR
jgi:cytochrome c551/c552